MKRYGKAGASRRTFIGSLVATGGVLHRTGKPSYAEAPQPVVERPQWTTSCRLLQLGEEIQFHFSLPVGTATGDLTIFPRYLELAHPGSAFVAGSNLAWLNALKSERFRFNFVNGHASLRYQPQAPGNYLARWSAGAEALNVRF